MLHMAGLFCRRFRVYTCGNQPPCEKAMALINFCSNSFSGWGQCDGTIFITAYMPHLLQFFDSPAHRR